jgi:hypothetical protein
MDTIRDHVTLAEAIIGVFEHSRVVQFYEWLARFETYLIAVFKAEPFMPLHITITELSRRLLTKFMMAANKPLTPRDLPIYALACFAICMKLHVDDMDNREFASKAVIGCGSSFTKHDFLKVERIILMMLKYDLKIDDLEKDGYGFDGGHVCDCTL